ncbi:MAG: SAM-dependent methyltransferase [Candidatus Paceibacterota bacterium]
MPYVSRGGDKLDFALKKFEISVTGLICADFGSNTGGFVDCLLQNGADKVYAVETGYGVLDWKLRNDQRVVVMERTNAMHVSLPEKADIITIDASWTKLKKIIPNALENLKPSGQIITLLKPHYEKGGYVKDGETDEIVENTIKEISQLGINVVSKIESPLLGSKGGNKEFLLLIQQK